MQQINCLIVDDEPLALELLEDNIKRIPFLNLVAKANNGFEALEIINKNTIDLIFLDIQMPEMTGLEFLQSLHHKPMIIFLTAYKKYALEGYEHDVLDYLVKPLSFERFLKAATKAKEWFDLRQNMLESVENLAQKKENTSNLAANTGGGASDDFFMVHADYSLVKVIMSDISYIEGLKDYVKIYIDTQTKPIITRMSLKQLEEILPKSHFMRIHKSYICNLTKVTALRKTQLLLHKIELPLSDIYKTAVGQYFKVDL